MAYWYKIIFLLVFPSLLFADTQFIVNSYQFSAAGCSQGTTTAMCDTPAGETNLSAVAQGVKVTLASQEVWYGISLRINDAGAAGTVTVRIDDDSDLSADYLDEITGVVVDSALATNWEDVVFTTCLTLPAGTYYIGVIETSGDVAWQREATTNPCADMNGAYASSGWNMSNENAYDWSWKKILNGS